MILKLNTYEDGWSFIDGIVNTHSSRMTPEIYRRDYGGHGRMYDRVYTTSVSVSGGVLAQNTENSALLVKEISVTFKDGKTETYLTDREAYLMSDEGKTIERIN